MRRNRAGSLYLLSLSAALAAWAGNATAQTPVTLQNATATYSQTYGGVAGVSQAIDGNTGDLNGWAIDPMEGTDQTAAFQTATNVGGPAASLLTFTLLQNFTSSPGHLLGDFRLSVTTDDRSTFANGLAIGGDVTANWTILHPVSATSQNGATLTVRPDGSILSSGLNPGTDLYTVKAITTLTDITGVRLEALTDPSLPHNGPGRETNGNFVLTEFTMAYQTAPVPEAGTMLSLGLMLGGGGLCIRGARRQARG